MVGDGESDPKLMGTLEAKLTKQLGNEFQVCSEEIVEFLAENSVFPSKIPLKM